MLARYVEVSDIDDERSFYETFADRLARAETSIWLWSPWTATRVVTLLPVLADAVRRGVRVTVFVRDPGDRLQQRNEDYVRRLRATVLNVISVHEMHQKIVVIDEQTTMLGSLNTLSQSRTREVMLTVNGTHFARKILAHENAERFARPPRCAACGGDEIDLRRRTNGACYWRCYNAACPERRGGRAWQVDHPT